MADIQSQEEEYSRENDLAQNLNRLLRLYIYNYLTQLMCN
jgi:hypothetical protein